ncbi:MAG TPA: tetratricopeptide repeat protein [Kofleriaceae bacterium]
MKLAALAALLLLARIAAAQPADGERSFRDASTRGDITALEQLGAQRPLTMWSDDAWAEAARLAVKANDFTRARAALEQVIAIGTDDRLVRRARNELARIASFTGTSGEHTAVAAEHERLAPQLNAGTDPKPALRELERLVRAHPTYPRAPMLMVALAQGWEREGEGDRAIAWLREAQTIATVPADQLRIGAELVRTLIRTGKLAAAEQELDRFAGGASPGIVINLRKDLDRAELRRTVRWLMWGVLVALAAAAVLALRRAAGSWRAALRRLARPPMEALFLVPISAVVVGFALTGNPLIARTVLAIILAGVVTSWVSGAILDGQPRVRLGRAAAHAGLSIVAILASVYLAVDRGHVIDFIIETWHQGHERG